MVIWKTYFVLGPLPILLYSIPVLYMQSWKQCALLVIPQWFCGNSCTWAHDVTVHHVPKCMSCHKAIVVITGRAHCFHDCKYIAPILLLWDLSTLCVVDHLWPLIRYIYTIRQFHIIKIKIFLLLKFVKQKQ